ncbi:MAG TPA: sulfatase-like hydrolase/transferase, partial [Thermoanaerobaculia bacterium]
APRPTTPTLAKLARESIVAENFFSNVSATGGSIVSMFTSALPTETGVVFAPDIAKGGWIRQHLPGLLREHGYTTYQLTVRWYADAVDLNLQSSFDWANGRAPAKETAHALTRGLDPNAAYFARLLIERLAERVVPSVVGREARDARREILAGEAPKSSDKARLREFARVVASAREPFFVQVHLLGTHGRRFRAPGRYSAGQAQDREYMLDFYDDAIAQFDERVSNALDLLARRGVLERTIFVVYADHGMRWTTLERLPLVIRAPGGSVVARVVTPAQGLDLAPTVLELAGLPQPPWMRGRSLLAERRDSCPAILSFQHVSQQDPARGGKHFAGAQPPFFSLSGISQIVGREAISLALPTGEIERTRVELGGGAGAECPALDEGAAAAGLLRHLGEHGYDVSTLAHLLGH